MADSPVVLNPGVGGDSVRAEATANGKQQVVTPADADGTLASPSKFALDGSDGTGITPPAGGVGVRGWLSGIYKALTGTLTVDGSGHTQPVSGTVAVSNLPGTQPVSGTVTVANPTTTPDVADRVGRLLGRVTVDSAPTAAGSTPYCNTALSSTKQTVKAAAGNLYGYHLFNAGTADVYVQCFNKAAGSVTVGTTTPDFVLAVPATATGHGGIDTPSMAVPIAFSTGLVIAATTTPTGSTAPGTALLANLFYA